MGQFQSEKKIGLSALPVFVLMIVSGYPQTPEPRIGPSPKPNIIYILADDLGYGDLECFNENSKIKTPNLNRLAQEGIRFTNAHATSSVCTPSRYSILTGRYNWRSPLKQGVLSGDSKALLDTGRLTVAQLLKNNGYRTAHIGKWHLGWNWNRTATNSIDFSKPVKKSPNTFGFDYSFGISASLDMPPYVYVENGMPTTIPVDSTRNKDPYAFWRNGPIAPDFVHDSVNYEFFSRATDYIKQQSKKHEPFFLYIALASPHAPILPTKEWRGKSNLNPYGDYVMMIDAYLGALFDVLKESGMEDNTLVIFTSDNGCAPVANYDLLTKRGHNPSYSFRGQKSDIYEGGHRVPFIVKWPLKINENQTCAYNISTADFMATCADILGVTLPDNAGEDSFSMLPLFDKKTRAKYARETTVTHSIDGTFAITKSNWKLVFGPGSGGWSYPTKKDLSASARPFQLYNLNNDLGEKNNLYDSLPRKAAELKTIMRTIFTNGRSTPGTRQENDRPVRDEQWWQIEKILQQ